MVPAGNSGDNSTQRGVYANPDAPPWWSNVGDSETRLRNYSPGESIDMRKEFPFRSEQWDALMKVLELPPEIRDAINERYREKQKYIQDMFSKQAYELGDDYDTFNIMAENKAKDDALNEFSNELNAAIEDYQKETSADAKRRAKKIIAKKDMKKKKVMKEPNQQDDEPDDIKIDTTRGLLSDEEFPFDDGINPSKPFTESQHSCDIDKAINERFAKTGDGFFIDNGTGRAFAGDGQRALENGTLRVGDDYESLWDIGPIEKELKANYDPAAALDAGDEKSINHTTARMALQEFGEGPWHHPMMNWQAKKARGVIADIPENAAAFAQQEQKDQEALNKTMNKKAGRSKRDLDTALTEIATGENPGYFALPSGRSVSAFIDQVMGHMQAGMSFEDAIDTVAESMTGRPLKKSCDIDQAIADRQPTGRMGPEPVRPRDGGQHR